MKKIMAVIIALMFTSTMVFSGMAFAGGPKAKAKAPMSDKAKEGDKALKDAKTKVKGKSTEAKMGLMDKKDKMDKMGKQGMKDLKSLKDMKGLK